MASTLSGQQLLQLSGISASAVATVWACAGVGAYAHRQGLLDGKAQKAVDQLIANVFLPCLILGKVTPNMSLSVLMNLWPLFAMIPFVVVYGLVAGALVSRALASCWPQAFPKYRGLIMVAIGFPNSFSVPLTLLLAVGDHPVLVKTGFSGEDLHDRISLIFLISYAAWVLARWSIGYPVLSGVMSFTEWRKKALNSPVRACIMATILGLLWDVLKHRLKFDVAKAMRFLSPVSTAVGYSGSCVVPLILFALGARLDQAIADLRASFSEAHRKGYPKDMEAQTKQGPSAEVVGLSTSREEATSPGGNDDEEAVYVAGLPGAAYLSVLVLRMVFGSLFSSLVACGILRTLCGVNDNVMLMVAMLQGAGPPMINISVMAGISGKAEMETSKLLLFTYGCSVLTWTASISYFLWLLGD